jgi:hypothetical protein
MKHALAALLLLPVAGCIEPPKTNRAYMYVADLQDLTFWDPINGGRGFDPYNALLALDPKDSVPALIATLLDPTPTRIYDKLHQPPTVGDVAFHILLLIFGMRAEDFASEGVWIFKNDPVDNPIYKVRIEKVEVREKLRKRFGDMALERRWIGQPD